MMLYINLQTSSPETVGLHSAVGWLPVEDLHWLPVEDLHSAVGWLPAEDLHFAVRLLAAVGLHPAAGWR